MLEYINPKIIKQVVVVIAKNCKINSSIKINQLGKKCKEPSGEEL